MDYNVWNSCIENGTIPNKNLLWVAEQIPGDVEAADVTQVMLTQVCFGFFSPINFRDIGVLIIFHISLVSLT